jgi:hypothetical protein
MRFSNIYNPELKSLNCEGAPCTRARAWPVFAQGTHKHWPQARNRWVQAKVAKGKKSLNIKLKVFLAFFASLW